MIRLQESIEVNRSLDDCFYYLADFSTTEQWDPGVYRAEKLTPGAPATGSEFEVVVNLQGLPVTMHYEMQQLIPNERIELFGDAQGFTAHDIITFEAISDQKTRINYQADLSFEGAGSAAEPLLKLPAKRVGKKAVKGLAKALAPQDKPKKLKLTGKLADRLVWPAAAQFTRLGYQLMDDKSHTDYLDGKTIVITGPTAGLGLAAACELSRLRANLVLVGRDRNRLQEACQTIMDFSGASEDSLEVIEADLQSMAAVKDAATLIRQNVGELHALVNNAGALFAEHELNADGFERGLGINLIAPWVLTQELMPLIRKSKTRVINVVSGGMYLQGVKLKDMNFLNEDYNGSRAYARAKRALFAATEYWTEAESDSGATFNCMHPGWADTPGVVKSLPAFHEKLGKALRDSRQGADTIVWLASSPAVEDESGKLWFDRRAHADSVIPNTQVSDDKRHRLIAWLKQKAV